MKDITKNIMHTYIYQVISIYNSFIINIIIIGNKNTIHSYVLCRTIEVEDMDTLQVVLRPPLFHACWFIYKGFVNPCIVVSRGKLKEIGRASCRERVCL